MPTQFLQRNLHIFTGFSKTLWKNIGFIQLKSKKNHSISCNNSGAITSQIELIDLTKGRKLKKKKHSSFSVKYCQCPCFLLIFSHILPVLPPASFSLLLSFVRNFLEVPGHVCHYFTHFNNISFLKTGAIP